MKTILLTIAIALSFLATGCLKTCHCTETSTAVIPSDFPFDPPSMSMPTDEYTEEAKNCGDLNKTDTMLNEGMGFIVTTVCK